jgi:GT2 family glycosyltransferase
MRIAVITPVCGRHSHLRLQRQALLAGTARSASHIIVAMNDPAACGVLDSSPPCPQTIQLPASPDLLPLAKARNLGAQHALEADAELLIFLDVDCAPGPRLVERYAAEATRGREPGLLCGPVAYLPPPSASGYTLDSLARLGQPHPARPVPPETGTLSAGDHTLFWSLSFAVTAGLWRQLGGFCERYAGYGAEDTDFGQIAAAHGVPLTWVGGAWAYHQYHPAPQPPRQHLHPILRNAAIFHQRWGWWPMSGWLQSFQREGLIHYDPRTQSWVPDPQEAAR